MKKDCELADAIPEGYEIYEHPANAQVFFEKENSYSSLQTLRNISLKGN